MPDRGKVIKAVECRKNAHKRCGNPCERIGCCEYAAWIRDPDGTRYYPCYCDVERLCEDVLTLLREQEVVKQEAYENGFHDGYRQAMREANPCADCQEWDCDECKHRKNGELD